MRIAVLHQAVSEESTVEEKDVLDQLQAVTSALERLGHSFSVLPCTLDLASVRTRLLADRPEAVFNLVESLGGSDRLMSAAATLLEVLGIPFTGVPAEPMQRTTGKIWAKRAMLAAGLPTAVWGERIAGEFHARGDWSRCVFPSRWIRKPIWEHASFGMTDEAVVECQSSAHVAVALKEWSVRLARPCLIEPYIAGREFNLSVIGTVGRPEVLPPAEILFEGYAEGKPKIVNFAAKWTEDAAEYAGTPRTFDFEPCEQPLLDHLTSLAAACWNTFEIAGYARVDFRVDEQNRPWILEINANPCFAPWSGFTAAVERSGRSYEEMVARLLAIALENHCE